MNNQRLFIAIDLPDQFAESLAALDPQTANLLNENLTAISFRSFFLPVIGLVTFSRKGIPHILWVGVGHGHPHLFQLHKRVNEAALACNLPIEERAWTPHFTIARARGISPALMQSFLKKYRDYDAGMVRVEEFHLYQSELTAAGAIHRRDLTVAAR